MHIFGLESAQQETFNRINKNLTMPSTSDWDEYDMRRMVMKSELCEEDVKEITQKMYKLFLNPKYVMRKVANIRSYEDMAFIVRGAKKVVGHLKDFKA